MGGQYKSHGIRMVLHSYEYHRWAAVLGELPRRSNLKTQIWDYAVAFSTKTGTGQDDCEYYNPYVNWIVHPRLFSDEPKTKPGMDKFFKVYESPKKKLVASSSSGKLSNHVGALEFVETSKYTLIISENYQLLNQIFH